MSPDLFYFTFALLIGILAGTITGLIPGIHINLVASLLLASLSLPLFSSIPIFTLAIFIVSMSITHTFLDFIPSIYLGAPDEDSFLSVLPGHEMLKSGLGHSALVITLYGSLLALPILLIFTPVFIYFLPILFTITKSIMPFILIFLSIYLIFREDNFLVSLIVFLLAGFLGFFTFQLPVREPLLPLLSGLFGLSSLIVSIKNKVKINEQKILPLREISLTKKDFLKASFASFLIVPFFSFLPGIGSGHASAISSELLNLKRKSFLMLQGSANTLIMALSFIAVYTIGKTRTGSAAAIQELLKEITFQHIIIILSVIIITSIFSFFLGVQLSKKVSKSINKINYQILTLIVIIILLIVNLFLSNLIGLIVLLTGSALGVFTILSKSRRINLMAALIVPVIIYYLT